MIEMLDYMNKHNFHEEHIDLFKKEFCVGECPYADIIDLAKDYQEWCTFFHNSLLIAWAILAFCFIIFKLYPKKCS